MIVSPRMQIPIVAGVGYGSTLLSAFDDALCAVGVHNYNLIPLTSVIPPGAAVTLLDRHAAPEDAHGHRLYVVKAEVRADEVGRIAGAGLGWYQWGDSRGVFVEHEAIGATRATVAQELGDRICHSLRDLCAARDVPFRRQEVRSRIALVDVGDRPTCALVLAIYHAEGWR